MAGPKKVLDGGIKSVLAKATIGRLCTAPHGAAPCNSEISMRYG
jgi:hypothetical protein